MDAAALREKAKEITRRLTDEGRIVEAGWQTLMLFSFPEGGVSGIQHREMRKAFFAGAQHIFSSMGAMMEDDREPTEKDLARMQSIHDELTAWYEQFKRDHGLA